MPPEIVLASIQPFPVEVMVFEEDTYLVLSAGNHVRDIRQPLEDLQKAATEQKAHALGDVVERGNQWFAIVHDFDRNPSFEVGSVETALKQIARRVSEEDIQSLKLQPLGAYHGPASLEETTKQISEINWSESLKKLWIEDARSQ